MSSFTEHLTSQIFRRLRKINKEQTKKKMKKLHLVLDLDHTLVHSVTVSELSQKEKYLTEEADSRSDLFRINKGHPSDELYIKLRPFVRGFLEEANKLFTMSVYTMGNLEYARHVLSLIDPSRVYFGDRVIAREQSPDKKTLDLVGADKRRVVILDDTREVWPHDKRNLLQITKYVYFREGYCNLVSSYAEEKRDESICNGSLAVALKYLKNVHRRFGDSNDLRLLMRDPWRLW